MEYLYITNIILGVLLFFTFPTLFFTLIWAKGKPRNGLLFKNFKNASRSSKITFYVILIFILNLLFFIILSKSIKKIKWNENLHAMKHFNINKDKCYINDSLINNPIKIFKEIQGYKGYVANHSLPDKKIEIRIESNKNISKIYLFRDSFDKEQYWIIDYKEEYDLKNHIGIIKTKILNDF